MPRTLAGWLILPVMFSSEIVCCFMAARIMLASFGGESRSPRYFATGVGFMLVMLASTMLYVWIEPPHQ